MAGHIAREAEKARQKELAKKKAAIEKELEAEINKRKSIEYYEAMAKEYSDNPKLAELVAELKQLGM
jgi:flagellar biosynthesis/type III secretory pathway chaperone